MKKTRRPQGTVVTKKTKKGDRYYPVVSRKDASGTWKRDWHDGHDDLKAAQAALRAILKGLDDRTHVVRRKETVAQYVTDWLAGMKAHVRPATWESYDRNVRVHVIPRLGGLRLQELDGTRLDAFYADLLVDGRLDRHGDRSGLAPQTVRYVHAILHHALKDAVRTKRIARNVALDARPPRQASSARKEMKFWTPAELRAFLGHVSDNRLFPVFLLAATTGMRRGEVLGARWSDLDLDTGTLAVRQTLIAVAHQPVFSTPKTKKGTRLIDLDPTTLAALKAWKKAQAEERLAFGSWPDLGDHGPLVFCKPDGTPFRPEAVTLVFDRRVATSGLRRIRFHDLRHTYATIALKAGVHVKVVSERLGHANIGITLDTYSHVIPGMGKEAADLVADLIFGGQS